MARRRRINETPAKARGQAGLTLVELLVVLSILAFAVSVIVLNAPPSRPPAQAAAERFAARLQTAFDAAVIDGAAYRLEALSSEYRVLRYGDGDWTPIVRETIAAEENGVLFRVEVTEAAAENALALNGTTRPQARGEEQPVVVSIDPFAGGAAINAYFESRRGDWIVAMTPAGAVSVSRQ